MQPLNGWQYWVMRIGRDTSAILLYIALPLITIFATRFAPAMMAVAVIIIVLAHIIIKNGLPSFPKPSLNFATLVMFAWASISLFWSPIPLDGLKTLGTIVLCVVAALFLAKQYQSLAIGSLWSVISIGLVLPNLYLSYEAIFSPRLFAFFNGGVLEGSLFNSRVGEHDLSRTLVLLVLVSGPLIIPKNFTKKEILKSMLFLGLLLIPIFGTTSQSIQIAFLSAIIFGLITCIFPSLLRWVQLSFAILIVTFPLIVSQLGSLTPYLDMINQGHQMKRVEIWMQYRILSTEKPFFGWGGNADKYFGKLDLESAFAKRRSITLLPSHPHNFIMQIWVNYGAVGAVLFGWLFLSIGERIAQLPFRSRLLGSSFLTFTFIYSMSSHSAYQSWWLATVAIAAVPYLILVDDNIKKED